MTKVEFYAGSTLLGTDASAPYSYTWDSGTVGNGPYALTTKAYDAAGNVGTSAAVNVTVTNMGGSCSVSRQLLNNPGFERRHRLDRERQRHRQQQRRQRAQRKLDGLAAGLWQSRTPIRCTSR